MFRLLMLLLVLAPGLLIAQQAPRQPAYLLRVPPSVKAVFVAEADAATLRRFGVTASGETYNDARYMSVGQRGVGKEKPWDGRTPLGIYFVNDQLDTSRLHEKYGVLAFPLDYPNVWDRHNKRSGDGIWIHGVLPGGDRRPPFDTDGCIALPNDELLLLENEFVPLVTPVIITRTIEWVDRQQLEQTRAELEAALDDWSTSYRDGDLHLFLSLYASDFSYRGMSRSRWESFRTQSIRRAPISEITLTDILLLEDPEDRGLFLSRFRQTVLQDERTSTTTKRLYWRRSEDGDLRIVAEDNG